MSGCVTTIDLDALVHNVGVVQRAAGNVPVIAVVKADGYGHGAVMAARAFLAGGAARLGVATVDEAASLRRAGISVPILAWVHSTNTNFECAVQLDIAVGLSTLDQLDRAVSIAKRVGKPMQIASKLDTGMNRSGLTTAEWPRFVDALAAAVSSGHVAAGEMFTHLAHGGFDRVATEDQMTRFHEMVEHAKARGLGPTFRHVACSTVVGLRPDLALDCIRPGLALYGYDSTNSVALRELKPAMRFSAEVLQIKRVPQGGSVSYGHSWTAGRESRIAIVGAGFADGLPRLLSDGGAVSINDQSVRVVGRVGMDQMQADVTDAPDVMPGDTVTLLGGASSVNEWGRMMNGMAYDALVSPRGPRVTREYKGLEHVCR